MRQHPTSPPIHTVDRSEDRCSYELPDDIDCNIPRRPTPVDCAAWNRARGQLVESCRATGGRPVALLYIDLPSTELTSSTVVIASTLRLHDGQHINAVTSSRQIEDADGGYHRWSISVNGVNLAHEDRVESPSPVVIGQIVGKALASCPSSRLPRREPVPERRPRPQASAARLQPSTKAESRAPEAGR